MRIRNATAFGRRYAEAFCLMRYVCVSDPKHVEAIWNSRDGVTPFIVGCRTCGAMAEHVAWDQDLYDPTRTPRIGERMFADLTPEAALESARRHVERRWDDPNCPMREAEFAQAGKEAAAQHLAEAELKQPGQPMIAEVTEEVLRTLAEARVAALNRS